MSGVSKSIFVLDEKTSEFLYDYISLVFTDVYAYKIKKTNSSFLSCFCCENTYESIISYSKNSKTKADKFVEWIINMSIRYLKMSNIKADNLSANIIECIKCDDKILIENSNKATVIFHFNDIKDGYVTSHDSNINFSSNDKKYIVVTFNN